MLSINALRPLKHYLPKDLMSFERRSRVKYYEDFTFVIILVKQQTMRNEIQSIKYIHIFYYMNI
jgi:ribonucleotide reductase beta subunit family protein with ferritin-like domain